MSFKTHFQQETIHVDTTLYSNIVSQGVWVQKKKPVLFLAKNGPLSYLTVLSICLLLFETYAPKKI